MKDELHTIAVLGCEVTGKLHRHVEVRGCACPADKRGRFCPSCGKSTAPMMEKVPMPFYDSGTQRVGDLAVMFDTDGDRAFAGVFSCVFEHHGSTRVRLRSLNEETIQKTAQQIRSTLLPLGLWDPSLFGLWSILNTRF